MGCAKHADNPLIHKPTHCYAIIWAVNGGGEKISSLNAISVCSLSLYVCLSSLLDFTYFPHNSGSHFIFFFLLFYTPWVVNFISVSLPSPLPLLHRGHCAACECDWFGRLAGVWPGLTHLLPGGLLSVPSQLTLRCVCVFWKHTCNWDRISWALILN